jgi:membrane protease subunit (stomatin/prohibitin family)
VKDLKSALSEQARLKILGDKYKQVRSFDVMDKAAENQSATGEMLGAGIGFGVGMGAAMPMARNVFGNISTEPEKSESTKPKIACDKCGRIFDSDAKFCPGCGDEVCPCPNCGVDNPSDAVKCRQCEKQLGAADLCSQCSATLVEGDQFCGTCGTPTTSDNNNE